MELAKRGKSTILQRKAMLESKLIDLIEMKSEIDQSINYIHEKNTYYDKVLTGEIMYTSNIMDKD